MSVGDLPAQAARCILAAGEVVLKQRANPNLFFMRYIIAALLIFCSYTAFSQTGPGELTPALEKKFKAEIEKEVVKLRADLKKSSETDLGIEFAIDTYRLDALLDKFAETEYSTAGICNAEYKVAQMYDSLLNKYYKKLLAVLKGDDKQVLVKTQKAWMAYRDAENELVFIIGKEDYAGGGTMQNMLRASAYREFVKKRTVEIVGHLRSATQDYN